MADPGGPYVIPEETIAKAEYEFTQGEMDNFVNMFKHSFKKNYYHTFLMRKLMLLGLYCLLEIFFLPKSPK